MQNKIYDPNNVFAQIISGKLPCNKVYEDDFALAFYDIKPEAPVHVVVIPKLQCTSFDDFIEKADQLFVANFFLAVKKVAEILDLKESGYRLITNHGNDGMQTVFHFHLHLLGKKELGKLV